MAVAYYSTEVTAQNAAAHTPSNPSVAGGVIRYAYGSYTTPSAGLADDSTVAMLRLPPYARIISLKLTSADMGNSGEAVDIGYAAVDGSGYIDEAQTTADDRDAIVNDVAVSSAVSQSEQITVANANIGTTMMDKEVYLTATVETDAWAGDSAITFECQYVVD